MLKVKKWTVNPFQENTYILYGTKDAILIDPGFSNSQEFGLLTSFLEHNQLELKAVWLTHAHIDHVLGLSFVEDKFPNIKVRVNELESDNIKSAGSVAKNYGIPFKPFNLAPVYNLSPTASTSIEGEEIQVLFTPGHSPGHLAFYSVQEKWVINGDVLFFQGIGRTDLPGGNFEVLEKSIKETMYQLPDETIIYCGHGPETSIGFEKKNNSFIRV